MKDKKRYSMGFKLKVMEELRDGKWKTVAEAGEAYGVTSAGIRYWMKRLGFEHFNGRIIYVKTTSEVDEIKRLKAELRKAKEMLADEIISHKIDEVALRLACEELKTTPEILKKKRRREIAHVAAAETERGVKRISKALGFSRQAFYKAKKLRAHKEVKEDFVLACVREERMTNPRAGTVKVLEAIKPRLAAADALIGRNKLNALLKKNNLLVEKRKVFRPKTTQQDPSLPISRNLVKDMALTKPNQAVCADITYISTGEGFLYLALVMDMVAKDIVGWDVSESLDADGAVRALRMAGRRLPEGAQVVAHSDRGCQYGSRKYLEALDALGWQSSMTEELHCYENAMAERLNGILKGEYYLDGCFRTKAEAMAAVKRVIEIYNTRRLHEKLGYKTPTAFREEMAKAA